MVEMSDFEGRTSKFSWGTKFSSTGLRVPHDGRWRHDSSPRNSTSRRLQATGSSPATRCHLGPAHCFWRYQFSWVEDEWHVFFVRQLYFPIRRALPFTDAQVCAEGHVMQGDGCTQRNLTSLLRHSMALPSIDGVVDFLLQAMKRRRESRRNPFPSQ